MRIEIKRFMNLKIIITVIIIVAIIFALPFIINKTGKTGIHKIEHIVIIMQENRAFDHYFGTYPGVDGIPMKNGTSLVCIQYFDEDCIKSYHDINDKNEGGPHDTSSAIADINKGKMDGFIKQKQKEICENNSNCDYGIPDVMGYHDYREIPNYWKYAQEFILQDHMFSSARSYTLPNHLFIVSAWSAKCKNNDPMSCTNALQGAPFKSNYAWTDITYLLHKNNISWALYEDNGSPDDDWFSLVAPLFWFETVRNDGEIGNIKNMSEFYEDSKKGTLPSVVWIEPNINDSEHPPALISDGQAFVTKAINAIMNSSDWKSTVILLSWDEFGGFYDHVPPPDVDQNGYGIRVPGLIISPYAKKGYIDHQNLSHDAYLKFIEDIFLNGQRIDPKTDGRPDSRPTVRENVSILGDLRNDFDFNQSPRPPLILDPYPKNTSG